MPFPARLVRPVDHRYPNVFQFHSASGQPDVRSRKIFVVKQVSRLPSTNATAGKKVRRILIFDNHPDSLRLVFGRRANRHVDLSVRPRASSWELVLVSMLAMGALIGMFWPLF
jgi:hypothetical protein